MGVKRVHEGVMMRVMMGVMLGVLISYVHVLVHNRSFETIRNSGSR